MTSDLSLLFWPERSSEMVAELIVTDSLTTGYFSEFLATATQEDDLAAARGRNCQWFIEGCK